MTAVTAPPVIAPAGAFPCREAYPHAEGVSCERPKGHDGGHLSQTHGRYWQAGEPQASATQKTDARRALTTRSAA